MSGEPPRADDRTAAGPEPDRSHARPRRAGLLLAGGRSTRFGEADKALATLAGAPLVAHAAAALAPAVDELVVNCRSDQREALAAALAGVDELVAGGPGAASATGTTDAATTGADTRVRFAVDPVPDEGPVAGLLTGLRLARCRHVLVAGCDQPFLRPATVERLFAEAETDTASTGAAPLVDERREPLGAVYRADDVREAAERTLAAGSRRLQDVLSRVDPAGVTAPPATTRDIDTQAELNDLRSRYDERTENNARNMEIIDESAVRGEANGAAGTTDSTTVTDGEPPGGSAVVPAGDAPLAGGPGPTGGDR